jgi:hypothetical protein
MTVVTTLRTARPLAASLPGRWQRPFPAGLELLAGTGAASDAVGGSFTMRYTTVVVTAARAGTA